MNSSGKCELKVKKLTVNKRDTKKQWDLAMAKDGWIRDPEVSGHKQASHVGKVMSLLLNMLSRLVTDFLPRSKRLLIMPVVTIHSDLGDQENKICH